jgi:hypothetical protein
MALKRSLETSKMDFDEIEQSAKMLNIGKPIVLDVALLHK